MLKWCKPYDNGAKVDIFTRPDVENAATLGYAEKDCVYSPSLVSWILKQYYTDEIKAADIRRVRDNALIQTDRFMLEDYPISSEAKQKYKEYRQYLREIPEQSDFPNLEILDFETWCDNKI